MQVNQINLEEGDPSNVVVSMTTREAALITKVLGRLSMTTAKEMGLGDYSSEHSETYACLTGDFFNRFWDDGVDGFIRGENS